MGAFYYGVDRGRWVPAGIAFGILVHPADGMTTEWVVLLWLALSAFVVSLCGVAAVLVTKFQSVEDLIMPDINVPPHLKGYVVLGKGASGNAYQGVVENSFSMALSPDRACFFWSSDKATTAWFKATIKVDGYENAMRYRDYYAQLMPDMEFTVFDVHGEDLPVTFDWDGWRRANDPADTLSGVIDKYRARNPRFFMRDE